MIESKQWCQQQQKHLRSDVFLNDVFLNSVPPCGTWVQFYQILAVLLPTFMYVTAILHGPVIRSLQKHVEKKSQWSTWTQPHLFQCDLLLLRNHPLILAGKIGMCSPSLTGRGNSFELLWCFLSFLFPHLTPSLTPIDLRLHEDDNLSSVLVTELGYSRSTNGRLSYLATQICSW